MRTFFLWLLMASALSAQPLIFMDSKKEIGRIDVRKDLPAEKVPRKSQKRTYRAVALKPLLEKVYGKDWAEHGDFFFVCSDGYRAAVPAAELKKYDAYLAYAYSDGKPFLLDKKPLGPYYLVWETARHPEREVKGSWPYQVTGIDRQSLAQRYSKVIPPKNAGPEVQRGWLAFRKYCLSCHKINGQGGEMGIDLNAPHSVTEYIKEPFLYKIIDDPVKVRNRAQMPKFMPNLPHREQTIQDIIAYLKAKAKEKR